MYLQPPASHVSEHSELRNWYPQFDCSSPESREHCSLSSPVTMFPDTLGNRAHWEDTRVFSTCFGKPSSVCITVHTTVCTSLYNIVPDTTNCTVTDPVAKCRRLRLQGPDNLTVSKLRSEFLDPRVCVLICSASSPSSSVEYYVYREWTHGNWPRHDVNKSMLLSDILRFRLRKVIFRLTLSTPFPHHGSHAACSGPQ